MTRLTFRSHVFKGLQLLESLSREGPRPAIVERIDNCR